MFPRRVQFLPVMSNPSDFTGDPFGVGWNVVIAMIS